MKKFLSLIPMVLGVCTSSAQDSEFDVVGWNVESDGSRNSTIARQLRDDFQGVELWGLSEVADDDAAARFEDAAEEGERVDYGRITGTTGGRDRLVILFDKSRFQLREGLELHHINVSGTVRAPLVARLRDTATGKDFSFMVNHLYRGSSDGRHRQATLLNEWAAAEPEPVIAVGDYNFDWHYQSGDADHDRGYDNMVADGRWTWIRPRVLVPTNASGHESVLDFVFFAVPAGERSAWDASSSILVRRNDFPDDDFKSDHRPVLATFEHRATLQPSPQAIVLAAPAFRSRGMANDLRMTDPARSHVVPPREPQERAAPENWGQIRRAGTPIVYRILTRDHPAMERSDDEAARAAMERAGIAAPQFVLSSSKRWEPGETVTVAFKGGSKELHDRVAAAASDWIRHANLKLDFGVDRDGNHRRWSASDREPAAYIRISFDQSGYYSLVGTDAIKRNLVSPGEETMNLEGFDLRLPADWRATVLHEFGHALGLQHEHQHPAGGCDFRWDDDPGYERTVDERGAVIEDSEGRRPGIYSVLGGWPNFWKKKMVDDNLRQLRSTRLDPLVTSAFDGTSMMKYWFDSWMFVAGEGSKCYSLQENVELSDLDKEAMRVAYPAEPAAVSRRKAERLEAIDVLLQATDRIEIKRSLESIKSLEQLK